MERVLAACLWLLVACGDDATVPPADLYGGGRDGQADAAVTGADAGAAAACAATTMAYDLETDTGTLYGTLELPEGCEAPPVVLIHAGSGPTDRDGNTPALPGDNDSLRLLARGLAERGVASVRFDKRGIAASAAAGADESELRFETYADDCAAWLHAIRQDGRFGRVSVVGHSEGSLIGMLAAQAEPVDAFVSLSGAGRPAGELLRAQLEAQLPPALLAEAEAAIEQLEAGQTVDAVPAMLQALFRASVQPYLISWFAYDPAEEIVKLDARVEVVQGTTDMQVSVSDAERLADARPDATLTLIEDMSHVLKQASLAPASQQAAYTDPSLPVMEELLTLLADVAHGR